MNTTEIKTRLLSQSGLSDVGLRSIPVTEWVAQTNTSKILSQITRPSDIGGDPVLVAYLTQNDEGNIRFCYRGHDCEAYALVF